MGSEVIEEVQLNDIGTHFEAVIYDGPDSSSIVDVSLATTKQIVFQKSDRTVYIATAEFKTDGTDGIVRYVTVDGDLTPKGDWKLQARVKLPDGEWNSNILEFKVLDNL